MIPDAAQPFIIGFGIAFIITLPFIVLDIVINYLQSRKGRGQ